MRSFFCYPLPVLAVLLSTVPGCGCRGGKGADRPYPAKSAAAILAHLEASSARAVSFQAESTMDYWVGDQRVKGTVLIMGKRGAYVRFNALSPTGDNVAADLACNGSDFKLVDYQNDCHLTGPCSQDAIAKLLRVSLNPDDFLLLAVGSTPIVAHSEVSVEWNREERQEVLTLKGRDGSTQVIVLDGRDQRWDVLSSTLTGADGKTRWQLRNKEFDRFDSTDGKAYRAPKKTRFTQPEDGADLVVKWEERTLNPTLNPTKFDMEIPAGLATCR